MKYVDKKRIVRERRYLLASVKRNREGGYYDGPYVDSFVIDFDEAYTSLDILYRKVNAKCATDAEFKKKYRCYLKNIKDDEADENWWGVRSNQEYIHKLLDKHWDLYSDEYRAKREERRANFLTLIEEQRARFAKNIVSVTYHCVPIKLN